MIVIPVAIVVGSLIGLAKFNYGLSEDQSLGMAIAASILILYATKELDNETE